MKNLVPEIRPEEISRWPDIPREGLRTYQDSMTVLVVEQRDLLRDCLCQRLSQFPRVRIIPAANMELQNWSSNDVDIILLCVSGGLLTDTLLQDIDAFTSTSDAALVLLSDDCPTSQIIKVLNSGARGFLPSSIGAELAIQALRLVKAGGTFVPPSCLGQSTSAETDQPAIFTERQKQVIEAIRRGKPNKIIAYELNMCESTVKVHVRSIMKKLKATNRTQVAYLYRD